MDRTRQTQVLSFTFLELGQAAMTDGTAWLTPVCVRTSKIDQVARKAFVSCCFILRRLGLATYDMALLEG